MLKSQFSILLANLFLIGSFLSPYIVPSLLMLTLAGLWLLSAVYALYLEKLEAIRLRIMIEEFNKRNGGLRRGANSRR